MSVLEGWQIPSNGNNENISFDPSAPQEEVCIWQSDFPADAGLAERQLQQAEEQVSAIQLALDEVPGRIETLANRAAAQRRGGVAFDSTGLDTPEAGLWRWLTAETIEGGVAYGLGDNTDHEWEEARGEFQRELERVQRLLIYLAWVETGVEGQWVGRSVLRWTGDMDTLWQEAMTPQQMGLHRRTLAVAVASRNLMLRTILLTAQNAAKLAGILATPAGVVLALPAVWRFIDQILAEVEQYRTIKNQGKEIGPEA